MNSKYSDDYVKTLRAQLQPGEQAMIARDLNVSHSYVRQVMGGHRKVGKGKATRIVQEAEQRIVNRAVDQVKRLMQISPDLGNRINEAMRVA